MRIIVAKNIEGRWQKVGTYRARKDGSVSLPLKFNGQIEGRFIRQGARRLAENIAIESIDYQFGTSPTYRVCRI